MKYKEIDSTFPQSISMRFNSQNNQIKSDFINRVKLGKEELLKVKKLTQKYIHRIYFQK